MSPQKQFLRLCSSTFPAAGTEPNLGNPVPGAPGKSGGFVLALEGDRSSCYPKMPDTVKGINADYRVSAAANFAGGDGDRTAFGADMKDRCPGPEGVPRNTGLVLELDVQ